MTTKTVTHTPGPWKAHQGGYVHAATGECICSFHEMRNRITNYEHDGVEEAAANAKLIAAAPELLEALESALKTLEAATIFGQSLYKADVTEKVRTAIQKCL